MTVIAVTLKGLKEEQQCLKGLKLLFLYSR